MADRERHRALLTVAVLRRAALAAARTALAEAQNEVDRADELVGQAESDRDAAAAHWTQFAEARRPDPMLMRLAAGALLTHEDGVVAAARRRDAAALRRDVGTLAHRACDVHVRNVGERVAASGRGLARRRDERVMAANEDRVLARWARGGVA